MRQGEQLQQLKAALSVFEKTYASGILEVCNRSSRPVTIDSVVSIYRDQTGAMRTVHSGSYGYPTWEVRSGGG